MMYDAEKIKQNFLSQIACDNLPNRDEIQQKLTKNEHLLSSMFDHNPEPKSQDAFTAKLGLTNKCLGIGACIDGRPVDASKMFLVEDNKQGNAIAQIIMDDTYQYSVPSSGVPSYFTTIWTTKWFKTIYQKNTFFELSHEFQQGQWQTTNIKIPTISNQGMMQLYTDDSLAGNTGFNTNWVDRETVTLQQTLSVGDMEQARCGMAKIDAMAMKRESLAENIALTTNNIGFNGFVGVRCFGLLNDPTLNPEVVLPASASNPSSTQWIYKSGLEIINDVILLHNSITSLSVGQVAPNDQESVLGVPPCVYTLLSQPASNLVTMSVMEYLKGAFPKMKIIMVQNYQGTGTPIGSVTPNYIQLVYSKVGEQECVLNAFSSLWYEHGMIRKESSIAGKVSCTLGGAIVVNGMGVATAQGV